MNSNENIAARRLQVIKGHLSSGNSTEDKEIDATSQRHGVIPKHRQSVLKWNGWGYLDTKFEILKNPANVSFKGNRYEINGKELPNLAKWVEDNLHVSVNNTINPKPLPDKNSLEKSRISETFVEELKNQLISFSTDGIDRLCRSHGQAYEDIYAMYHAIDLQNRRIPDIVVWPKCHDDVVKIVELCKISSVAIIPIGGGTSVADHLGCPVNEERPILSVDLTQMNRVLWVDEENLTACVEAGITGICLENDLAKFGYCTGHEPDSQEFSTLGGWISTRASGMKKSVYGNIEDIVVHIKLVSPEGTIQKNCMVPRMSSGPDIHQIVLGSEGTLGVITEAIIKIRPKPSVVRCGSLLFPTFELGVKCLRECAKQRLKPASIRLMDNQQLIFGLALKPAAQSSFQALVDKLKKIYVTKFKGFDPNKMCMVTLLFEGPKQEVDYLEAKINSIAQEFCGMTAGEENGRRGYTLTFVIAYLRDCALELGIASESFETSVPWDRVLDLCNNVKTRICDECVKRGVIKQPFVTCRVTQSYDSGACVYFYFAFSYEGVDNNVQVYHEIEAEARNEVLANGGSISHHHGVGKCRKKWVEETISPAGLLALKAIKKQLDPSNIFACDNLL